MMSKVDELISFAFRENGTQTKETSNWGQLGRDKNIRSTDQENALSTFPVRERKS
jgi:hypothetical protein